MNRKERREFERENRKREQLKKTKMYKDMKALDGIFKGNGTDVEKMKAMCLAYEPNPEPIQILFIPKETNLFEKFESEKFSPIFCYIQEKNGTFSKIKANGLDYTKFLVEFEQATKKEFEMVGAKPPSQEILNIETIKLFNSVYESQGGGLMDVVHYIFTDHSLDQIIDQSKQMETYFLETYKEQRRILVKAVGYRVSDNSNLEKVG